MSATASDNFDFDNKGAVISSWVAVVMAASVNFDFFLFLPAPVFCLGRVPLRHFGFAPRRQTWHAEVN